MTPLTTILKEMLYQPMFSLWIGITLGNIIWIIARMFFIK